VRQVVGVDACGPGRLPVLKGRGLARGNTAGETDLDEPFHKINYPAAFMGSKEPIACQ
jgi:hypothetical protein